MEVSRKKILLKSLFTFMCIWTGLSVSLFAQDHGEKAEDQNLSNLLSRESSNLSVQETEGPLQVSLLSAGHGTSRFIEKTQQYELKIPIGSNADVVCYTSEKESDAPHAYLKAFFDQMSSNPLISKRSIVNLKADLIQDLPYIYMDTEYLTTDAKYGRVKSLAFSILGNSFFCIHDEPGYQDTFLRVVSSLAQSDFVREFKKNFAGYSEKQIDLIYINEKPVGFFENYEFEDENTNRNVLILVSYLIPASPFELVGVGTLSTAVVNRYSGQVESEGHFSYLNNEVSHELNLKRTGENEYHVTGVFSGKSIDSIFESKRPLMNSAVLIRDFSKKLNAGSKYEFQEYSPFAPTQASAGSIELKNSPEEGTAFLEYTSNAQTYNFLMDKNGYRSLRLPVSALKMDVRRSFYYRKK